MQEQEGRLKAELENNQHIPVLLKETIDNLNIKPSGIYIDATFGRGGHSRAILQQLDENGQLMVIDTDPEAITAARIWQEQEQNPRSARLIVRHGSFTKMREWVEELNWIGKVNGILLDLGVSSPQLEVAARGFSFIKNGHLDMRMNPIQQKTTAAHWINQAELGELEKIFKLYGEERFSKRIAKAIVKERALQPILTTGELATIVSKAHPRWEKTKHPATRVFQAIRIFINNELTELRQVLKQSLDVLQVNGRLLAITFHSLEDRTIKHFMRDIMGGNIPSGVPLKHEQLRISLRYVASALRANNDEIKRNPRARSATLRVMERIL